MTTRDRSGSKIGIYVDTANLYRNGGFSMRYDILRDFAARDAGELIRLNAYVTYDEKRGYEDAVFRKQNEGFQAVLRDAGYKVIIKNVKWYHNEDGTDYAKANSDLDMAVDALLQSENLDRVLMATGDGDFVQVVRALQNKGCRVEVVAFDSVSSDLRREADLFMSGYLIPNLTPTDAPKNDKPWGQVGSRVRGVCYTFNQEKFFGFMRYMKYIGPGLWNTDTRRDDSPFASSFAHGSAFGNFDVRDLPSRDHIFEFTLVPPTGENKHPQAAEIVQVFPRRA